MESELVPLRCKRQGCGLDFLHFAWKVYLSDDSVAGQGLRLYCPACSQDNSNSLNDYGFFHHERKFYRWRSSPVQVSTGTSGFEVKLGKLNLVFPEDLIGDLRFSKETMCYSAIPVFAKKGGHGYHLPSLPVRREFLDLVDLSREPQAELVDALKCRFRFYSKISEDVQEVVLPLVAADDTRDAVGDNAIISGVHLLLWPKIQYKEWNRYFIRLGGTSDVLKKLDNDHRSLDVYALASKDADSDKAWVPVSHRAPDGLTRLSYLESRPEWIAIEVKDKSARENAVGGGLWRVLPATEDLPAHTQTQVGVDFGTSNTCFALKSESSQNDDPQLLSIDSRDERIDEPIIDGSDLPTKLDAPDLWPPSAGFGKKQVLVPTELVTRKTLREIQQNPAQIREWKPILDYTIPTSGVEVRFEDKDYTIAEFKLASMFDLSQGAPGELQKKYLELILLCVMARLANRGALRKTVSFTFSYPLAFDQDKKTNFEIVLHEVGKNLSNPKLGVTVSCELAVDEARAAARSGGHTFEASDNAALFVDIGGGSADIAFLKLENGRARGYNYVCSFEYAGGALAAALVEGKGDCLRAGTDFATFRRKIRASGSIRELAATEDLFLSSRRGTVITKSSYFYGYLLQFLARLLAAHILTRECQSQVPQASKEIVKQPAFNVVFYGFGNGWGYGDLIDRAGRYRNVFGELLEETTNSILQDARAKGITVGDQAASDALPEVKIKTVPIKEPKSAVACGLLRVGESSSLFEEPEWPFRTIVGWTTTVNLNQKIEWYLPIEAAARNPKDQQPIPGDSKLDCREEEWPALANELPTPQFWDKNLDKTRGLIEDKCSPKGPQQSWLQESPFRILLEHTFKDALKKAI